MLIFDKAYYEFRNKYIVPLSQYSVQYRSMKNVNIKQILFTKFTSVDEVSKSEFVFHFDKDTLLKGLLGDIQLFYLRQLIQYQDAKLCMSPMISANWNIVSNYYYSFFCGSLLLRLCFRGNIFIDSENKRKLEVLVSNTLGHAISLDSNQFFEIIVNSNNELALKLSKAIANTHELVWKKLDEVLDEMLLLSRNNSDEMLLLKSIKKVNTKLGNTYPSKLRNRVNYQPIYGMDYLDKKLYPIMDKQGDSWLSYLLDYGDTKFDDNQIACAMVAYTKYIENMCNNFIAEYFELRGNANGVLKQFNKNRENKITIPEKKYVFDL